jgi:plastocyanin
MDKNRYLRKRLHHSILGILYLVSAVPLVASQVTGRVLAAVSVKSDADLSGVVVSLTPVDEAKAAELKRPPIRATLVQKNKAFSPHILVIPPGSVVQFPNRDPFFHNVFSLFEGKRFDLGLYESGSTRSVKFDRPGVSYVFCNIHPQMSAIVIALDTPYYALADKAGNIRISDVMPGQYLMQIWAEGLNTEDMQGLFRRVTVDQDVVDLGKIEVPSLESLAQHKNKYGREYDPADPTVEYGPH